MNTKLVESVWLNPGGVCWVNVKMTVMFPDILNLTTIRMFVASLLEQCELALSRMINAKYIFLKMTS